MGNEIAHPSSGLPLNLTVRAVPAQGLLALIAPGPSALHQLADRLQAARLLRADPQWDNDHRGVMLPLQIPDDKAVGIPIKGGVVTIGARSPHATVGVPGWLAMVARIPLAAQLRLARDEWTRGDGSVVWAFDVQGKAIDFETHGIYVRIEGP